MKRNTSAAKAIVCTVVLWTIPLLLAAQRSVPKLEDLPRRAIDTLDTDDSNIKIVIFTNNTWCYYYPDLNERMDREVYREHWVNDRVFAYMTSSSKSCRRLSTCSSLTSTGISTPRL